jgi:hypothetical protein
LSRGAERSVMHPALPHTGSDIIPLAGLGALTLLAGAGAVPHGVAEVRVLTRTG